LRGTLSEQGSRIATAGAKIAKNRRESKEGSRGASRGDEGCRPSDLDLTLWESYGYTNHMPKKQPQEFKVDVEFEGKVYSGVYVVSSGTITVEAEYGSLTTQAGGPNVKFMARQLFREILEGAKSRGELKK